ncbi:hypothetical protein ABL78_3833 [Leptomonas seymouri]|uniref:Uncharacterized protein n=1 Tax=Leptomonas seymouri TaxID=5684 RepID=A0A0N1IL34_LEPSE|nr:hypothetical protein ABL78_3833 [Leptomonas seymouri]|eukprot:KPI87071.1 hypothetical protein ABL78_3833 [Leptomonas seymouri]
MSRIASINCPLSDCTLAVDNAENIRNSDDKTLLINKLSTATIAPSPRKNVRSSAKQISYAAATDAVEKAPSARRERVVGGTRKVNVRTVATMLEEHSACALDTHIFVKPVSPFSTPRRNDPYSPCLLNSRCSPEDSFYACYCNAVVPESDVAEAAAPAGLTSTPVRTRTAGQKVTTLGEATHNLLEMLSLISTPSKSSYGVTPVRPTEELSPSSSPEHSVSPSQLQQLAVPSASTRVVRKVVSCNVDRTSGRPVPKPKTA